METVGERIRILREMKGFSQENMAQELGISQQGYSKLECRCDRMKLRQLKDISTVLGVDVSTVLSTDPLFKERKEIELDPEILALKLEVELLRQKVELQNQLSTFSLPPPPFISGIGLYVS